MNSVPRRVVVQEVLAGRDRPGEKPLRWEKRQDGIDRIRTTSGEDITLTSGGAQSTPAPGWELLLIDRAGESDSSVYSWTLYGLRQNPTS